VERLIKQKKDTLIHHFAVETGESSSVPHISSIHLIDSL